jgi:hypothetical protein
MSARKIVGNIFLGLLLVMMTLSALGGIAAAVWSAIGAGSGSAGSSTTVSVALTPGTPAGLLYPGGQSNVVLTVTNTNSAPVRIGSFALDPVRGTGGFSADSAHTGCVLTALSYTTQSNGTTGWTVPAKVGTVNGTLAVTLTNALAMSTSAVNACQSAVFTVYLAAAP